MEYNGKHLCCLWPVMSNAAALLQLHGCAGSHVARARSEVASFPGRVTCGLGMRLVLKRGKESGTWTWSDTPLSNLISYVIQP